MRDAKRETSEEMGRGKQEKRWEEGKIREERKESSSWVYMDQLIWALECSPSSNDFASAQSFLLSFQSSPPSLLLQLLQSTQHPLLLFYLLQCLFLQQDKQSIDPKAIIHLLRHPEQAVQRKCCQLLSTLKVDENELLQMGIGKLHFYQIMEERQECSMLAVQLYSKNDELAVRKAALRCFMNALSPSSLLEGILFEELEATEQVEAVFLHLIECCSVKKMQNTMAQWFPRLLGRVDLELVACKLAASCCTFIAENISVTAEFVQWMLRITEKRVADSLEFWELLQEQSKGELWMKELYEMLANVLIRSRAEEEEEEVGEGLVIVYYVIGGRLLQMLASAVSSLSSSSAFLLYCVHVILHEVDEYDSNLELLIHAIISRVITDDCVKSTCLIFRVLVDIVPIENSSFFDYCISFCLHCIQNNMSTSIASACLLDVPSSMMRSRLNDLISCFSSTSVSKCKLNLASVLSSYHGFTDEIIAHQLGLCLHQPRAFNLQVLHCLISESNSMIMNAISPLIDNICMLQEDARLQLVKLVRKARKDEVLNVALLVENFKKTPCISIIQLLQGENAMYSLVDFVNSLEDGDIKAAFLDSAILFERDMHLLYPLLWSVFEPPIHQEFFPSACGLLAKAITLSQDVDFYFACSQRLLTLMHSLPPSLSVAPCKPLYEFHCKYPLLFAKGDEKLKKIIAT